MNIVEMHNTFRTIGQQNGIQLIRSVLPESIDVYLNNAIMELTKEKLAQGVVDNIHYNITPQASTMSLINTFGTLYKTANKQLYNEKEIGDSKPINKQDSKTGYYQFNINNCVTDDNGQDKIMMILGVSVTYASTPSKNVLVPCRIISVDNLELTLTDYCNGASKQYPIAVVLNDKLEIYSNTEDYKIMVLNIKYIKYPNVVKLDTGDSNNNVDCDLPEHLHFEIVEKAVDKFFKAIDSNVTNKPIQTKQ